MGFVMIRFLLFALLVIIFYAGPASCQSVADSSTASCNLADVCHYHPDNVNITEEGRDSTIGQATLELTNEFRAQNGLTALQWDEQLSRIGWIHSRDMGEGISEFSHVGLQARFDNFPNGYSSAGENLYMAQGYRSSTIASSAVQSWINSPGHRANLLGNWKSCGVGVYENSNGAFYLTQLFDEPRN